MRGLRARPARALPLPPRPSLPPTLGCALGMWASAAAVLMAAEAAEPAWCVAGGVCALLGAGAGVWMLWRVRAVQMGAVVLGCALGCACACACAAAQLAAAEAAAGLSGQWRFEAVEDGRQGLFGSSCLARVRLPGATDALVRLELAEGGEIPHYGDVLVADATLSSPSAKQASYCWREGAVAVARIASPALCTRGDALGALTALRSRVIDAIGRQGDGDGPAVLAALVCGWRAPLDEGSVYAAFKATGLAHLVAVSGAHLSLVAAFAGALLRALHAPRAAVSTAVAALLLGYLVLAAAPPSAVRAAVMAFAGMLSLAARRRPAALGALSVCMMGCIALSPRIALSASFALSALSTLGIVVFAGWASAWVGALASPMPRFARDALALTLASSILATPLSAALFAQLPLIAPLANVLAAPLFPAVCAGGLAAALASLALPWAAGALLGGAVGAAGALAGLVRLVARIPHASVPASIPVIVALVASALVAAALWRLWPRPSRRVFAAVCAVGLCAAAGAFVMLPRMVGDEIVMLDVGQGDAFVVRSRGASVLVDTGNQDRLLREALARHGVFRLDAVIVTHGDDDHMGSLASLAGVVTVDRVLVARDALACPCDSCARLVSEARALVGGEAVQGLAAGDALRVGAFTLNVVWPERFADEGGNADSVCLVADADVDGDGTRDWRALFTGDAERDQMRELLDSGAVGAVDVYKVGHHGSKNALDEEVAAHLAPRIALVSAGTGNRYGHPAPETLQRLEDVGARILRTDEMGDVSCEFTPERIEVDALR